MHHDAPCPLARAAIDAAERGWRVFPLVPGDKRPALHGADECRRTGPCAAEHVGWEPRATTDPQRIARCWERVPYNVAIATGPSNLVVVDLDTPKEPGDTPPERWMEHGITDGADVFAMVCEQHGQPMPTETYTVRTGSGGTHLYFTAPPGTALRNTSGDRGRGLGWKVDTRAGGGYVVAAGSIVRGCPYTVVHDAAPAPLPGWLAARLAPPPLPPQKPVVVPLLANDQHGAYLHAAVSGELDRVTGAHTGNRNTALYQASVALGQLVAGNELNEYEVTEWLTSAAVGIGLPEAEARRTVASGLRAGAKRPRTVRRRAA